MKDNYLKIKKFIKISSLVLLLQIPIAMVVAPGYEVLIMVMLIIFPGAKYIYYKIWYREDGTRKPVNFYSNIYFLFVRDEAGRQKIVSGFERLALVYESIIISIITFGTLMQSIFYIIKLFR